MCILFDMNTPTTVLGFDFGMRHIGVAVGQSITKTARGLAVITAHQGIPDWKKIATLITQWHPDALIVGLPLDMEDKETQITKAAKQFGQQLFQHFQLPIHYIDEKLSSREARTLLMEKREKLEKNKIDKMAAQLILESWLSQNS
jgi:putative Holliday junction resolvase